VTDPLGTVTQYTYDGFGNPLSIVRDAGAGHLNQTTTLGYSTLGDVVSLTDPSENVTTSAYDANRRLTNVTAPPAPTALVTAYSYDPDGRLLQPRQSADGAVLATTSSSYTPSGKLATATDANGNVTGYAYDAADRLARVTDAAGRVTTYGYDAMSRLLAVSNPAIQSNPLTQSGYTPDGLLASLNIARSDTVADTTNFTYDGFDRLSTTTYPDSSAESLTYDANGNILTRETRKGDTLSFTWDTLNRLSTKAAPSEATVSWGYDLAGRPTSISDSSAAVTIPSAPASYAASTTYDAMNRPTAVTWGPAAAQTTPAASAASFTYGYDPTNRRVSQSATDNSWWSYPTAASAISYTPNNLNQYSAVGAVTQTYDGNGNLTHDGGYLYGFDAESRLTGISSLATAGNCDSTLLTMT
jgi:YD repeat-containing protein